MSVQFDAIEELLIPHLGLIWEKYRSKFPKVEQHPPLNPVVERVRPSPTSISTVSFTTGIQTPRVWFVSEDDDELVQIQNNRFVRNWRKREALNRPYPHYEPHIRPGFLEDLRTFRAALSELAFGEISINQCELTYVNRIVPDDVWTAHTDLHRLLNIWPSTAGRVVGSDFESVGIRFTRLLKDEDGSFLGRLHFDIQPAFVVVKEKASEQLPVFACNLVARGQPTTPGDSGVVEFFDLARSTMIELFESIFTEEIQSSWQRKVEAS